MSLVSAVLLGVGVAASWLGAAALLRLAPLGRIHAAAFINVAAGGVITLGALTTAGATPRTAKILLIWIVLLLSGALSAHVAGRAIHVRGGER